LSSDGFSRMAPNTGTLCCAHRDGMFIASEDAARRTQGAHLVCGELLVDAVQPTLCRARVSAADLSVQARMQRALWRSSEGCCSNISSAKSRRLNDFSVGPLLDVLQKSS
jgi:hypothetical protein